LVSGQREEAGNIEAKPEEVKRERGLGAKINGGWEEASAKRGLYKNKCLPKNPAREKKLNLRRGINRRKLCLKKKVQKPERKGLGECKQRKQT